VERIIAHIDMDAFFASVEQVRRPWLKGKPIGVTNHLGERGVIATASYEARACGIKSGMPVKTALKILPSLILIKGDITLYEQISDKIYGILIQYAPVVERFSIDEAFLDLTYKVKSFEEGEKIALKIKEEIKNTLGLPSTIGISFNKLLAKIASKEGKPDGLLLVTKENFQSFLKDLPLSRIPGIGKKIETRIKEIYGAEKIGELQKIGLNELIKTFHSYGAFIYNAIHGIDNSEVTGEGEVKEKSIGNSTTLKSDTDSIEVIKGVIRMLSSNICFRLRRKNLLAERITITIRYEDFSTFSHSKNIEGTDSEEEIFKGSLSLFNEIYNGEKVRLLGITLSKLRDRAITLFKEMKDKDETLSKAVDTAKEKFGIDTLCYANSINLRIKLQERKISGR